MIPKLDERKVLVTGGAGFIGSEVVRQFYEQNADVTVLDNFASGKMKYIKGLKGVKVVKGDVCNEEVVSEALKNQELVVHLAALPFIPDSYYHPQEFFKVHTVGSINMMWGSIKCETVERFVHISSSEVYGTAKYVPMARALETSHVIPALVRKAVERQNPFVVWGTGESTRDFIHAKDIARGMVLALEKYAVADPVNLATGRSIKIKDLVYMILKLSGHENARIVFDECKPTGQVERRVNIAKAKEKIGFVAQTSLEEGLKETIDWYRAQLMKISS